VRATNVADAKAVSTIATRMTTRKIFFTKFLQDYCALHRMAAGSPERRMPQRQASKKNRAAQDRPRRPAHSPRWGKAKKAKYNGPKFRPF
jgi:hypothetical protein